MLILTLEGLGVLVVIIVNPYNKISESSLLQQAHQT